MAQYFKHKITNKLQLLLLTYSLKMLLLWENSHKSSKNHSEIMISTSLGMTLGFYNVSGTDQQNLLTKSLKILYYKNKQPKFNESIWQAKQKYFKEKHKHLLLMKTTNTKKFWHDLAIYQLWMTRTATWFTSSNEETWWFTQSHC